MRSYESFGGQNPGVGVQDRTLWGFLHFQVRGAGTAFDFTAGGKRAEGRETAV